jgi:indole-3-glycerol phosphate synthase
VTTASPARPDLLGAIVASACCIVQQRREAEPATTLERRASVLPPTRDAFVDALGGTGDYNVIAECKRRSPARGVLRPDYRPDAIAAAYAEGGAAALSVLTEPAFFDGALEHLTSVRRAVRLPLLRKDFIVDEYQIVEARAAGASAVLLIVAALDDVALRTLLAASDRWGVAALVEVHDAPELQRALAAGATIIGVNNRNLRTLSVSLDTAFSVIDGIPESCIAVAESGLRTGGDLRRLRAAGYDAFLIGEGLMTAEDPGAALRLLLGDARAGPEGTTMQLAESPAGEDRRDD